MLSQQPKYYDGGQACTEQQPSHHPLDGLKVLSNQLSCSVSGCEA